MFSRLQEYKDTVALMIFTLDLVTHHYPVITVVESLPYDCFALTACSTSLGGVVILAGNSIVYVDQASRRVILPLNGWPARTSDMPMPSLTPDEQIRDLQIEGARFTFVDERTLYIFGKDGTVYPVEIILDGKTVSRLSMSTPIARSTIPAIVRRVGENHLFIGSTVGPSVLLRTARVEEDIPDEDVDMTSAPATVVAPMDSMDLDDDEGEQDGLSHESSYSMPFQYCTGLLLSSNLTLVVLLQMGWSPPLRRGRSCICHFATLYQLTVRSPI